MPMESLCWLLLGIFLGLIANLQKSGRTTASLPRLAVNFGVWVLLGHQDATAFLERACNLWLDPARLDPAGRGIHQSRSPRLLKPSLWVRYVAFNVHLSVKHHRNVRCTRRCRKSVFALPIVLAELAVAGMLLGILKSAIRALPVVRLASWRHLGGGLRADLARGGPPLANLAHWWARHHPGGPDSGGCSRCSKKHRNGSRQDARQHETLGLTPSSKPEISNLRKIRKKSERRRKQRKDGLAFFLLRISISSDFEIRISNFPTDSDFSPQRAAFISVSFSLQYS